MSEPIAVRDVRVTIADIPTMRPHVLAMTTMKSQAVVLVEIERDDGICGYGEATTIGGLAYGEESPEGIKQAVEIYFKPLLLTCDANRPAATMAFVGRHIVGNRFAKCAVETALLDGLGQARDISISELVGGRQHDTLPVAWTLASGETAVDVDEAERMLAEKRHDAFKLKIGRRDVASDCAHVAKIACALAGRASVRVDVNQHWSRAEAFDGIAQLQDAGVVLVEQPIAAADVEGMKQLCGRFDVAIMADEALNGAATALRFATESACDAMSLKITQSGGVSEARKVAVLAEAAQIGLYGGTMLEGGIGTAAAALLFATLPRLDWGTELFGPLLMTEELLVEPLSYRDYGLVVPTKSGLGVRVDLEKLRFFERS